nr:response regulator [candidate division Zixibacteria bacterium]
MSEIPKINGRPVKILIVDDEDIVLSFARDALEDLGCDIHLANDALEAIKIIEKEFFDFILTDIRMPGMDGLELARRAREIIPSIGIIFMTGYANLNTAKDAIKEGAFDYIMKPFELNEIRQAVKSAVKKSQKETEKTLSNELNRLSDLNQLMYTVSDRRSLMRLSLGFAMMQGKTDLGCVVFKNNNDNEIGIISTDTASGNGFEETFTRCSQNIFEQDYKEFNKPFIIRTVQEHPLTRTIDPAKLESILIPTWHREGYHLVNIALKRASKLHGFLILGYTDEAEALKESELKLLGITTSQIAISLENIILLEESRNAYRRLKDLQEQTIQLEKMATKGQMSAEIGHELNNFLGVVVGNLSLMQAQLHKKNYTELERYLQAVMTNLDNIKKFTNGLMDFSRIKSSQEECDINALIADVIEYLRVQRHFMDVKIIFEKSNLPIITMADTGQLQQLLYNLLNNAADAMQENSDGNERQIRICTVLEECQEEFSLSVQDNGGGIDPENLERMFNTRFTTKKTGHGFGLLVCRRIIDNHKGRLRVESNAGQGTTITINLPVRKSSPAAVTAS